MKNNFIQRAITGVLFVVVLAGSILYHFYSFSLLFALISALTVYEFASLVEGHDGVRLNKPVTALSAACLFLGMTAYHSVCPDARVFLPYGLLLIYLTVSELYLKRKNPLGNWAFTMLSQLYIALPFSLLNLLVFTVTGDPASPYSLPALSYDPTLPLSLFVFIWLSDTGAYCVGSLLGRHRLFERISPKKSWEGSIGGSLFAIASSLLFARFCPAYSSLQWAGLAAVIVVFGTWGDLTESLMKRQLGIKDSGHILPGHGGMLDRFDSALLAIPAAVIYLMVIG